MTFICEVNYFDKRMMVMLCYLMLIDNEEERQKFKKIYITYRMKLQYVAVSILKDSHEAENIVHDTFLTIIDNLDKIDEIECNKTWNYIVTILKNKCFNYIKKQKRCDVVDTEMLEVFEENTEDIVSEILQKEMMSVLQKSIQQLKYPYKEVIYLQYYNELSSKEIGKILGISAENVRQIAKRAKKCLKEVLVKMGYQYEE